MAGFTEMLARNGETLFHYSPEAGDPIRIALGKQAQDDKGELDLLLSGYSVERYGNMTICRGDHRLVPCISVLWFCQPFLLRELLSSEEAMERGLSAARMLPFLIEPESYPEDDGSSGVLVSSVRLHGKI